MANNKKRWLTFEIYPDNPEQMAAFEWLKTADINSGMYIKHSAEKDEKKDHIHVLVYEDNPINCTMQGEQLVAKSYGARFGTFDGFPTDSGFLYKCKGDILPDGMDWQTYPIISMVQGVSDPQSLAHYFLHERYCDIRAGKKLYKYGELKFWGDKERFTKLYFTNKVNDIDILGRALGIAEYCETPKQFMARCASLGEWDILEFARKNPYFVAKFVVGDCYGNIIRNHRG